MRIVASLLTPHSPAAAAALQLCIRCICARYFHAAPQRGVCVCCTSTSTHPRASRATFSPVVPSPLPSRDRPGRNSQARARTVARTWPHLCASVWRRRDNAIRLIRECASVLHRTFSGTADRELCCAQERVAIPPQGRRANEFNLVLLNSARCGQRACFATWAKHNNPNAPAATSPHVCRTL